MTKKIPRNATIRRQTRTCGRDCPRCPHGPYWYAYWQGPDGRTRSAYVGSDQALRALKASWRTKARSKPPSVRSRRKAAA